MEKRTSFECAIEVGKKITNCFADIETIAIHEYLFKTELELQITSQFRHKF